MITSERMAMVDRNAVAVDVSRQQLMESAGNAVARAVREMGASGDAVTVVAGRGNNGGDAFAATRFLDDRSVTVLLLGRADRIRSDHARTNWDALQQGAYDTREVRDSTALHEGAAGDTIASADVIVDGILGTGITGELREPAASAAARINDAPARVVSVDVPSGVNADTGAGAANAVAADRVVTFHDMKPGLVDLEAEVTVADIGIPPAAERFVGPGDLQALSRPADAHKGDNGEVLVVGGGPYSGAPALAAQAALRGGADLVRVACPAAVADAIKGYSENLIVRALPGDHLRPDHVERLQTLAAEHDSVVLGPGLGRADASLKAATDLLETLDGRVVVDADPLQVIPGVDTDAELLCTPHRGELARMGQETPDDWRERADIVGAFAAELGHTLLVKGPNDIISDGTDTRINRTGNPGMTVGGTGDVLAGLAGALLATHPPLRAGAIAAYANGAAGDRIVDERGYGLLATDLPPVVAETLWNTDR